MEQHHTAPGGRPRGLGTRLVCAALVVATLCALAACGTEPMPQPDFPLTEVVVTAALEQTGLPGVISPSETQSYSEGHIAYTLRDQTQTYGDTDNKLLLGAVASASTQGGRYLELRFFAPAVAQRPTFGWETWKQQLVLAAMLYGGVSDQEAVYRAFSQQTPEDGETIPEDADAPAAVEWFAWEAQLSAGYCTVRYSLQPSKLEDSGLGHQVPAFSPALSITIYETEALYQDMLPAAAERREAP